MTQLNYRLKCNNYNYNLKKLGPQITVSVYSGNKLQGFGRVYAPLQPGRHILNSVLIKPVPSSIWDTVAQFFGYEPEYFTSSNLATNNRKFYQH